MANPDASGRLIKWTIKLNEYDIQYHPQTAIKAQDLTNFLVENSDKEKIGVWKVFVDSSTTCKGSGVKFLLVSPQGDEIQIMV